MRITTFHRRVARALWEAGGQVDEVARLARVRPDTIRRWLADPEFRALLAEDAQEPLLQAASAVMRWAPAAVARLIQELDGDSPADARQAAREILKLAVDARRELATAPEGLERGIADGPFSRRLAGLAGGAGPGGAPAEDPFSRRVARLSDAQLERVLGILNEKPEAPAAKPEPAEGNDQGSTAKGK